MEELRGDPPAFADRGEGGGYVIMGGGTPQWLDPFRVQNRIKKMGAVAPPYSPLPRRAPRGALLGGALPMHSDQTKK